MFKLPNRFHHIDHVKDMISNKHRHFLIIVDFYIQENMTLDYDERFFHGKPQNSFHKAVNIPDVVVFPRFWDLFSSIKGKNL